LLFILFFFYSFWAISMSVWYRTITDMETL